jgi:4-amino-4-deoxy-L-arabinose transferase-like glycosyltransferase
VLAPALSWLAIRVLLDPARRRRIPLALLVGLIAFGNAALWAHVTPAFDAPDESEHFAYVQSLVERGKPLEHVPTARSTYSSEEALGIRMTRILDGAETADGKPPWLASQERIFNRIDRSGDPARDDGGGFAAAGSSHSPAYYSLVAPAYALASGGGLWDQLFASRLVSAILGGIVAACAFLIVLELLPGRRRIAAAAGFGVAFQPMFAFMAGSVNNDMGVNAGAAVVTLLAVQLIRRGFSLPRALALGVMLALTPLLKATGFAVAPAALLAVALAVWRYRPAWRRWVPGVLAVVVGFAVVWLIWTKVSASLDRGAFTTPNGQAPGQGFLAEQDPTGALTYVWEVFLPRLPGMNEHWSQSWPAYDIYGVRGWGAFGWYALTWKHKVYWVIMLAILALSALGVVALWRRRGWTRRNVPELLVLAAVVLGVIGVMNAAYYSPTPQGDLYPQQGRYLFPAIAALAALFAGATYGVGRRWVQPLAAGLATAVICFGYASLWLVLSGFYFAAAPAPG